LLLLIIIPPDGNLLLVGQLETCGDHYQELLAISLHHHFGLCRYFLLPFCTFNYSEMLSQKAD